MQSFGIAALLVSSISATHPQGILYPFETIVSKCLKIHSLPPTFPRPSFEIRGIPLILGRSPCGVVCPMSTNGRTRLRAQSTVSPFSDPGSKSDVCRNGADFSPCGILDILNVQFSKAAVLFPEFPNIYTFPPKIPSEFPDFGCSDDKRRGWWGWEERRSKKEKGCMSQREFFFRDRKYTHLFPRAQHPYSTSRPTPPPLPQLLLPPHLSRLPWICNPLPT